MVIPFLVYFLLEDAVKYLKKRYISKPAPPCVSPAKARDYLRSA